MEKRYQDLSKYLELDRLDENYYTPPSSLIWKGREDGDELSHLRWHQAMHFLDLTNLPILASEPIDQNNRSTEGFTHFALLGFASDEGVRRNFGRPGASQGPESLRKALANLPVHRKNILLYDAGTIHVPDGNLEGAQEQLGIAICLLMERGFIPLVLGGGHEVTFGHYLGHKRFAASTSPANSQTTPILGICNFDAHFDNRNPEQTGPSSGTGFWQIYQQEQSERAKSKHLALGIQEAGNTQALFEQAQKMGYQYLTAANLRRTPSYQTSPTLESFVNEVDRIYLSIDLDVFSSSVAPGVSASVPFGLMPDQGFFNCLDSVLHSGKLGSVDLAELNPSLDIDQRTAKLGAWILHYIVENMSG